MNEPLPRPRVSAASVVLGLVGVLALAYGAWLLLDTGRENVEGALTWLVGGVVLHDGIVGPVVIVLAVVGVRAVPGRLRAPATAAAIVIGTVTFVAIPVLDRPGAKPDNPSLLPRDYVVGWLLLVGAVVAATVVLVVVDRWRRRRDG